MKADILREKFLNFFKAKKHKIIESASLVPGEDPTVLFTPAGMNQFKKQFLGMVSDFTRAATAQRCLRTDDLDKVGKTPGHHTFFEMLGNFSFGDYFKEEAILWAWQFLTEELKIPEAKLWVSVYKDDQEAYKIWKDKIGVTQNKIIKLGDKENFWPSEAKEKGPNGPCGPCSEIFFDQGSNLGCQRADCNPSCDCGRFVEVWNLVFTQFNRKDGGILEPLPRKNIDTGMGLERLAAVTQGVDTNFKTDLFKPIVEEIASDAARSPKNETLYAIADHIRAIVFAIYDGVLPSNDGRGYVVRKLIRRARMHLWGMGIKKPLLYRLVPVVSEIMRAPYPGLMQRKENISEIILAEEKGFISTFNSSDALFSEKFRGFNNQSDPARVGRIAFELYDTYGIPLELTVDWLHNSKIPISKDAFSQELKGQKNRSKLQSAMKGDVFGARDLHLDLKETKFSGYRNYETKAKIIKIIKDSQELKKITKGDAAKIVLDKTVFYGEAGGQVADTGEIIKGKNVFEVLDTQRLDKVIVHIGRVKVGSFRKNDLISAKIDIERRLSIARNHTATHLLQAALRKVLGSHVKQQGSLVAPDRLRFDFTHFKDITKDELNRIEEVTNSYILDNYPLVAKQTTLQEARKKGALAFFAEKYEGRVRVISIGDVSQELCAGTHLNFTGQIGIFKITQEGSIASCIRRIEAVTGKPAYKILKDEEILIADLASTLNVPLERLNQELEKKLARLKELERHLSSQKLDAVKASLESLIQGAEQIKGIKVIAKVIENADMDLLRKTVDLIKERTSASAVALASVSLGKVFLVIGLTTDLLARGLDASVLIREVAAVIGGSGGGRKDFAQAGGNKPQNIPAAFAKLKEII